MPATVQQPIGTLAPVAGGAAAQFAVEKDHVRSRKAGGEAKPLQGAKAASLTKGGSAGVAAKGHSRGLDAGKQHHYLSRVEGVQSMRGIKRDDAPQVRPRVGRKIAGDRIEACGLGVAVLFGKKQRDLWRDEERLVQPQYPGETKRGIVMKRARVAFSATSRCGVSGFRNQSFQRLWM